MAGATMSHVSSPNARTAAGSACRKATARSSRRLRREKAMKLATPPSPGRAYTADEKARMLAEAAKFRGKNMYPALVVDLNCGLRDKELRELRWWQIDLVHKKALTVGKSKTDEGTGRVIPLNDTVRIALEAHAAWYVRPFGACKPEWYVFAAGKGQPNDPTRPMRTLRTAWTKVRKNAKVVGRWHDNRRTLVTELAESGAGDELIMSIAGHVSRAMLSRYSHVRMEAKRRALLAPDTGRSATASVQAARLETPTQGVSLIQRAPPHSLPHTSQCPSQPNSISISDSVRVSQWGIDGRLDRSSHLATSAFLSIASARNQSS